MLFLGYSPPTYYNITPLRINLLMGKEPVYREWKKEKQRTPPLIHR